MKSTRRLLSIILCLIMCLSLLPTAAFAADNLVASGTAGLGVTFKLYQSGKLVINGIGGTMYPMNQWSFDDDPTYVWTADDARATRAAIKELIIEEGVIIIGEETFHDCPNLTRVSLPESMTYIYDGAFRNCSGLTAITIPSGVTNIGAEAFKGCVSLTDLLFTKSVRYIGECAFQDCTKLGSVTFPAGASLINEWAFANCKALKTIAFLGSFENNTDPTYGVYIDDAFLNVTADVYYPVDNDTWNFVTDPMNTYNDFGGRLTWHAATAQTSSNGWVLKPAGWYYYVNGVMITSNWKSFGGKWFYFGADGRMLTGRQQVDGNYYYFGQGSDGYPLGARVSGLVHDPDDGNDYFYDDNGVWQPSYSGVDDNGLEYGKNGWQKVPKDETDPAKYKWFYIRNKAKVTGWLYSNKYWYYLDPTTGAMVTGWLNWKGNSYYLRPLGKAIEDGIPDKEGSMIANRSVTIGDTVYTFDKNGALVGGKLEENPAGLATGFRNEGSTTYSKYADWKFYRSDGTMVKGWLQLDGNWYYFDNNGKMQTGWKKIGGVWYYLTKWEFTGSDEDDPADWDEIDLAAPATGKDLMNSNAGKMVTGFNKIPYTKNGVNSVKTYYFKNSGALNGKGWIKVNLKWYFLEQDGVVATGWFRDKTKWYFLDPYTDPIGEMVTGFVENMNNGDPLLDHLGNDNGGESFKASGEWIGSGNLVTATKAGNWKKHDDNWYYYNANGDDYPTNANAVTGWQLLDGKWYYLDPGSTPPGKMLTGWQDIDGEKYFFKASGEALGGWQKIDDVWFYMNPKHDGGFGKVLKGWQFINNYWYYFNETTGAMQDGWIEITSDDYGAKEQGFGEGWYLLNPEKNSKTYGAMQKGGWKQLYGKWYYFHSEGDGSYGKVEQGEWIPGKDGKLYYVKEAPHPSESWMVTNGAYTIDGKVYYFDKNGVLQNLGPAEWKKIGDKWYYFDVYDSATGGYTAVTDTVKKIDGKYYGFGKDGAMLTGFQNVGGKTYFFNTNGDAVTNAWKTIDGKKYYFGSDGAAVTGKQDDIGGKAYYFDSEGVMQTGFQSDGGKWYYYGDDGVLQKGPDWLEVGSEKYYIKDATGVLIQSDWLELAGEKYHFDDNCYMEKGKTAVGEYYYYFDDTDGHMLTDVTIDSDYYDSTGQGPHV